MGVKEMVTATTYEVRSTSEFDRWFSRLKDKIVRRAVSVRIARVGAGNFGDVKKIGAISELRINTGPGYRVYFTIQNRRVVFLLVGGDKRTQQQDIELAKRLAEAVENE